MTSQYITCDKGGMRRDGSGEVEVTLSRQAQAAVDNCVRHYEGAIAPLDVVLISSDGDSPLVDVLCVVSYCEDGGAERYGIGWASTDWEIADAGCDTPSVFGDREFCGLFSVLAGGDDGDGRNRGMVFSIKADALAMAQRIGGMVAEKITSGEYPEDRIIHAHSLLVGANPEIESFLLGDEEKLLV